MPDRHTAAPTTDRRQQYAEALTKELTRYARTDIDPGTGSDVGDQVAIVMAVRDAELEQLRASAAKAEDFMNDQPARLLDCGFCYEEHGEEVHPHPECPIGLAPTPADELRTAAATLRDDRNCDGYTADSNSRELLAMIRILLNARAALADWLDSWTGIDLYEAGPLPEDARHALAVARAIVDHLLCTRPGTQPRHTTRTRTPSTEDDEVTDSQQTRPPTPEEDIKVLYSRVAKLNDAVSALLAPEWGSEVGIISSAHPLYVKEKPTTEQEEQAAPVDWQVIAEQRERELKTVGEARHRAEAAIARIRQMADAWEQRLPDVIRTPAVVSALRAALDPKEAQ